MSSSLQPKAVALISGGLDSMLAAKVVMDQGVDVEGVNFYTGFCVEGHTHAIRKRHQERPKRNNALWVANQLGIKLHVVDVVEEYKDVVLNPKHGYGKNLNPCLDCKVFMVGKAMEMVGFHGEQFDFAVTGEVIGQRPKSQRRETMPIIAHESGAEDRLLRPLCAKSLPETLPERMGWVKRENLFGFSGRTRKPQIELAKKFGIENYAQPAGGCCFLTDETYSNKLKDLWIARDERDYELDDVVLLKIGRHIRPQPNFKLVIAREEGESRFLQGYRKRFTSLREVSLKGPLALIDGRVDLEDVRLAAKIVARYGQSRSKPKVAMEIRYKDGSGEQLEVEPFQAHQIPDTWHVGN
ncbi:MAG: tRNA (5-methylaminomethyl-2-thiouridylate)-methyltransferase [Gammaproteobacteria bacterium]|nr:tRNA (5-methylaminomethyl-2-thiouridylate)-methyltransferase [Gammaproteobacteria bacterium]MYD79739.1 tRNA (5-methylaminomethyl-2-thiouridylate)-methyltransferase [Gammaproteobacteria bacterium]